jgi:phytoene dehydrogenase-like protein
MSSPYHLTIIGARFPQLALAALTAKRGKKVLIIDQKDNGTAKERTVTPEFHFLKRPTPLYGMDSKGLLRRFLDEIGIGQMLVGKSHSANPVSFQIVLPRHRLNVYAKRERLLTEIAREFPGSVESFRDSYQELEILLESWKRGFEDISILENSWPPLGSLLQRTQGLMQARKLVSPLDRFRDPLREGGFLALQHHFLGGFALDATPDILSTSLINDIGKRGTFQETTGKGSLTSLMATRFTEYGGTILKGSSVTGVSRGSRSGVTVMLDSGQKIDSAGLATTEDLARGMEGLVKNRDPSEEKNTERIYPVRFYFGIDENIIPTGMEDNLFVLREKPSGPLNLQALYLALTRRGSEMAPEGKRSLTVTGYADGYTLSSLNNALIKETNDDIIKALDSVIPFLSEGLEFTGHELAAGDAMKMPRPLGSGVVAWNPGMMGRRRIHTTLRGRAVIMAASPRELGLEGETLTALAAAGALKKVMGKG